uniref:Uncharacterized protein n=1 Tax=Octopus bimaculoides TaxID=37653 RepID=A0A0L8HVK8_OCTBM
MSARAVGVLIGWKAASDHIITTRFQMRLSRIIVIQAYAPIKDTEENALDYAPHHDLVLLIVYVHIIGPNSTAADTSNNSDWLVSFCLMNGLMIRNTYFDHKKTQRSPDGRTFNEVDYI